MREFAIFVLSIASGAAGYLIATFWERGSVDGYAEV